MIASPCEAAMVNDQCVLVQNTSEDVQLMSSPTSDTSIGTLFASAFIHYLQENSDLSPDQKITLYFSYEIPFYCPHHKN
jgi:hypothetical protein